MRLTHSVTAMILATTVAAMGRAEDPQPSPSPSQAPKRPEGLTMAAGPVEQDVHVEPAQYLADPLVPRVYGGVALGVGAPGGAGIFGGVSPTRMVGFEWFTGGGNFGLALALGTRLTPLRTTIVDASIAFMASLSFNSEDDERRYPSTSQWYSAELAIDFRLFDESLDIKPTRDDRDARLGEGLRLAAGWTLLGNWRKFAQFDECASLNICDFSGGNGGVTPRDARVNALAGDPTLMPYVRVDWYAYFDL